MANIISDELVKVINAADTLKALATVDKNGVPHVVFKGSIHADDDGNILFYEILESSRNEQNLVHSIWFDKKVAINVLDKDKNSYEITGKPVRCVTCGREFEHTYEAVRGKLGDIELAAIWYVEPENVVNETFKVRVKEEKENYPLICHLDRITTGEELR
jgi:hypothetical protein